MSNQLTTLDPETANNLEPILNSGVTIVKVSSIRPAGGCISNTKYQCYVEILEDDPDLSKLENIKTQLELLKFDPFKNGGLVRYDCKIVDYEGKDKKILSVYEVYFFEENYKFSLFERLKFAWISFKKKKMKPQPDSWNYEFDTILAKCLNRHRQTTSCDPKLLASFIETNCGYRIVFEKLVQINGNSVAIDWK